MDKNTLSHYGWIVVLILILSVLLALATPFGKFVGKAFEATYVAFSMGDYDNLGNLIDDIGGDNGNGGNNPIDPTEPTDPTEPEEPEPPTEPEEPTDPTEPEDPEIPEEVSGKLINIYSLTYSELLPEGEKLGSGLQKYNGEINLDVWFWEQDIDSTNIKDFNEDLKAGKVHHLQSVGNLKITFPAVFTANDGSFVLNIDQMGGSKYTTKDGTVKTGYTYILVSE